MNSFDYVAASDVESASKLGASPSTRFVAGGTTLIDLMKLGVERPSRVVDLNTLDARDPSLSAVTRLPGGGWRLGALARMSDVAWHPQIRDEYPLVSQALLLAASGQLRNMATMGGNILQRTRCPYFRDTATPCNKREPGSGCSAIRGFNRTHAILGTSEHCIATHPSDLAVAFAAVDAVVHARAGAAERTIPFAAFHLLPGAHPEHENSLKPGEVVTAIDLPPLSFARRSLYFKVRDRASYAFALAAAAVALDLQDGAIRDARVALGGVGTTPWRSHEAERALVGKRASDATFRAAAQAALAGARPHKDNAFKIELAKRTLVRALTEVSA
ncbi:MAG TPA: xanthine dehydrogenase family protein subunit M [Gemmatimonadaceae bacterium]|jgi:xanthine dehydrogenase YagS FAD-binding subunit|nr:xanthine dehydrogenase family protein subunit M [Gemmatimonadaceae bacterium]